MYSLVKDFLFFHLKPTSRLYNYLTKHRKHSGLSQSDVSFLVRLKNKAELSRYERNVRVPSLRTALACQELYGVAVSDLFAGLSDSVASDTRSRMKRLQARLQAKIDPKITGNRIMQKFQWVSHRLL